MRNCGCKPGRQGSGTAACVPVQCLMISNGRKGAGGMTKRVLRLADRKRLRDEAIVDFRHGFINRREFMFRATAAGVSAAFAGKIAGAVAAPAPKPERSRWQRQAEATV